MKSFVFYGRVSTKKQSDGYSLEAQREAAERYLRALPHPWHLAGAFTEVESGKINSRPELAKALALAKAIGGIILLSRLDRLSRNASFLIQLMESNVDFVCLDCLGLDRFSISILALVAQRERENTSARTVQGLQMARLKGKKLGNPNAPEAWKIALDRIQERKRAFASDALKSIREIQGTGIKSLNRIADCLNKRGDKTPRGKKWTHKTVGRVLQIVNTTINA